MKKLAVSGTMHFNGPAQHHSPLTTQRGIDLQNSALTPISKPIVECADFLANSELREADSKPFQDASTFKSGDKNPVQPRKVWLFMLSNP